MGMFLPHYRDAVAEAEVTAELGRIFAPCARLWKSARRPWRVCAWRNSERRLIDVERSTQHADREVREMVCVVVELDPAHHAVVL
jgi:hypothetical protein